MRIHTDEYKQALIGVRETEHVLRTYNNGWEVYDNDNLIMAKPILNANLFKTVMKELDIESKTKIEKGTMLDYKHGLKVGNDYEYMNYGRYYVYEVEYRPDTKSYYHICYDNMLNAMVKYEPLEITYPISVKNYITAIAGQCGLIGHTPYYDDNFANQNKMITEDYFSEGEYTYRDILDYLCEVIGGWLYINNNNDLKIKYPTETKEVFNEDYLNYINITFEKKYGPVNSVVLARANELDNIEYKDDESIEQNGLCRVKFSDNPFLSNENRNDYLQELGQKIVGLEFYLNDLESKGITYLELGDIYSFKISEEMMNALKSGLVKSGVRKAQGDGSVKYKCLMLNDEQELGKGIVERIYTDEPEEDNSEYIITNPSNNSLKNAEIIVNKTKGELVLKANSDGQVVQARLDADADNGSLFEVKADNIKLEGYTTINNGFSVDLEGNMTCRNANVVGGTINGAYLELSDEGSNDASIQITNTHSVTDGRGSYSSNLIELDGNGHIIYISTDSVFDDSASPFTDFDNIFKIYQNGNAWLRGTLTQGSKENLKKDFEKYENALDEINKIDIYKYRFNTENNKSKKHIGFIIGDKYNYSKEITSENDDGVDLYSFVSLCCKAIQEQQEQIEQLKEEIKSLKGDDK